MERLHGQKITPTTRSGQQCLEQDVLLSEWSWGAAVVAPAVKQTKA